MKTFGEVVKESRTDHQWTMVEVAERLSTVKGYICGLENGKVNPPSVKLTVKMAKLYNLDPKELVLLGWVDKAPKMIRDELRKRVFG